MSGKLTTIYITYDHGDHFFGIGKVFCVSKDIFYVHPWDPLASKARSILLL